jgi:hypothetical protein
VGAFQVKIPVTTKDDLLFPEENTLAIMKWRLQAMSPTYRWYEVLKRYISYLSARVDGLGGDSAAVKPSLQGVPFHGNKFESAQKEMTGKVCEVIFNCFGDFEGFTLSSCDHQYLFKCHERSIGEIALRACKERLLVSIYVEEKHPEKIRKIVIRC